MILDRFLPVEDYGPVSRCYVYGLPDAVIAAKYPMATDPGEMTSMLTDGIRKLAQAQAGSAHDNWLTGITVQFDLTFTVKAWTEAERYHFFQIVSSQSTMHRITRFDLDTAYIEYVDPQIVERMKCLVHEYNTDHTPEKYLRVLYSNPCGMKLTARINTTYAQLKTQYRQRKTHRLPEWRAYCEWIETLPLAELITGGGKNGGAEVQDP